MIPRQYRLPSFEINLIYRSGKKINGELVQLIIKESINPLPRVAIKVPVSVVKKASGRNRCKRLLRESIRHLMPLIAGKFNYLFFLKKNIKDMPQVKVEESLKNQLMRTGIIK
jgi:ribonuclease P protein component